MGGMVVARPSTVQLGPLLTGRNSGASIMGMNTVKRIRADLGLSQSALGALIGVTQGSVSFYENGAVVPPEVAARLIKAARAKGLQLNFDHVYAQLLAGEAAGQEPQPENQHAA